MRVSRIPALQDLPESLQKVVSPANPKMMMAVAKGLAPLAPEILIEAWCYLKNSTEQPVAEAALNSLQNYPEKMLMPVLKAELSPWALEEIGLVFQGKEEILEAVLLNQATPDSLFVTVASNCSERLTILISSNQERIIQSPEIIQALESNPKNLKSNTDRLRHFLRLAGVYVPGDASPVLEEKPIEIKEDVSDAEDDQEKKAEEALKASSVLNEEQRTSLLNYIMKLNVGSKIKLAFKGNKEARQILIRDVNSIVALSVLKSPRLNENEVALYASLRNVGDDVIRTIATSPQWTKSYQIKLVLCRHPKAPLNQTMSFIKFLTLRDLGKVSKDKNIPAPLKKAAKELLNTKRK